MACSRPGPEPVRPPLVAILVWSLLLPACGGKTPGEATPTAPAELPFRVEQDRISLSAAPVTDSDESSSYFRTNLLKHGVLAVFVRIENQRSEEGIVVWSEGFELQLNDGPGGRVAPHDPVQLGRPDFFQKSLNVIAILGIVTLAPVIIASIPLILMRNARFAKVRTALPVARLWSGTVEPGDSTAGFLYFPIEKGWLDEPRRATLFATVELLKGHQSVLLERPLELSR